MERDIYSCTRTACTIPKKTMEDGNVVHTNDDKINSGSFASLYGDNRPDRYTANGHELTGEPSSPPEESYDPRRLNIDAAQEERFRKRINPLRIHLGKRPFVDNSHQYLTASKKRKPFVIKTSDSSTHTNVPRMPKLIPKRADLNQFRNVSLPSECVIDNEQDKPVPRLVPKSQLLHYKKGKIEKGPQLKEYPQNLGLQPMVKFKCRKCCSMSFKTLAMLKEHQLVCRAQAKEPALSPEAASCPEPSAGGPSRVTRKVYLCSACGTYYENWNLFLHMREVHNRHICLFCLGMFSKAEKLSSHLANKHNVKEFSYSSKEEFLNVFNGTLYLMCCVCEEICSEQDDFFNHDCNNVKPKPVPVLVSKNSMKANNVKNIKNCNEYPTNGPTTIAKEMPRPYNDTREINETKFDIMSHLHKAAGSTSISEMVNSKTSIVSDIPLVTSKDCSNTVDSGMELENSDNRQITSPTKYNITSPDLAKSVPNGDDHVDHSGESNSPIPEDSHHHINEECSTKVEEAPCPPSGKEKECGIKLTLSLNSAKSPVIINSTVDPSVGQQNINKPPSRLRRPPKRYEKDTTATDTTHPMSLPPKTPSIKMTICDRADSPFVKTTIIENNKETTLKTIMNNNLKSVSTLLEPKQENAVKTTIYDNKLDDVNTLNRVPKLTVRVPKELLDKDSSSDYSSDSDISEKLTVDENNTTINEHESTQEDLQIKPETTDLKLTLEEIKEESIPSALETKENGGDLDPKIEPKIEPPEEDSPVKPMIEEPSIPLTELSLDRPLDKYPLKDLLKVFLSSTIYSCIYCNHVRKIAVNCEQLALHMVAEHRFAATVDSITAEELLPETITAKLRSGAEELNTVYINLDSYDSVEKCETVKYDHLFECFQCYFKTAIHKDLYLHNRKMHQKTILLCVMCKSNFYSYSELLCHLCPGTYDSECEVRFRCCLCNVDSIPSPFRLMVHIRKIHHTCDVCLEFCQNQARLLNHVWKHKLHHFCFRCGISYRNKLDITNHLFWKHGTESVLCKRCLQKKWPHVYHFCNPPAIFACDECNLQFTKAVYLKVHKRFHTEEFPHLCTEEGCTEKFVSQKLLNKHMLEHKTSQFITDFTDEKPNPPNDIIQKSEEPIPVIDLVDNKPQEETGPSEVKPEAEADNTSKKSKKKKIKDKDALLLDVNLPALNLSESDSSDESDSGLPTPKSEIPKEKPDVELKINAAEQSDANIALDTQVVTKTEEKIDPADEEKTSERQVLDIWDNFKKYQANVEKQKEKTPPLVTIRKHVCESDHDYCLIPTDMNGDDDVFSSDKKAKSKKSPKKPRGDGSSSSSSSSDSDSSCSCGSNCSCSSSSGSSSSSSSDSDSSEESGTDKKKTKKVKKILPNRRISTGSNVDVMGNAETPILTPEKVEPPVAESDLETEESDTDEEFYDEHPQRVVDKLYEEKRNQLLMLASVAPSDGGSISGEASRPTTPVPVDVPAENLQEKRVHEEKVDNEAIVKEENEHKPKLNSGKKKNKKKKKSKSSRKHGPIKINIPKEVITKSEVEPSTQLPPTKITISLQSNTVQIPEAPKVAPVSVHTNTPATSAERKRASKRRRVPNKFYGYSSDEEPPQTTLSALKPQTTLSALKPQQPPKLEWRKEDLPSPVTNKVKKEIPSTVISSRLYNYTDPIRLTAPIPDAEPPKILMNTESMGSSDSDSSDEGNLEIYQPNSQASAPIPPPTYLNSGTSSLPYAFQRPAVREAREGESVYCYCRCPYDEVSEMIACDAEGCTIEWFHFECVGIMVPPKGKWYCPECRKNQNFPGYR